MASKKIALVTGANKGIGFYIAKNLLKESVHVILSARDRQRGADAVNTLKNDGLSDVEFWPLDITKAESLSSTQEFLKKKYPDGIDILVNNAGFAFKGVATEPIEVQARVTIDINYYGTLHACEALLPYVKAGGQVVNVSSTAGLLSQLRSDALVARFAAPDLTISALSALMEEFIACAASGTNVEQGWRSNTYSVSKIGVSALTRVLARQYEGRLFVNAVCPGWCRTDMAGDAAPLSAEEGAVTPVWVALGGAGAASGCFFKDRKQHAW